MKQPTNNQIQEVKNLLSNSIEELIRNDSDIFNIELIEPPQISEDAKVLNRELHETTINHRFAYYLEKNIQETNLSFYKVDIEYNRFYYNSKKLNTVEGIISVRPDILIHTRVDDNVDQQHYLAIEAKKANITQHDTNKVKGFITDENYNYLFGLTISYCSNENSILSNLYYYDGTAITSEEIYISKN